MLQKLAEELALDADASRSESVAESISAAIDKQDFATYIGYAVHYCKTDVGRANILSALPRLDHNLSKELSAAAVGCNHSNVREAMVSIREAMTGILSYGTHQEFHAGIIGQAVADLGNDTKSQSAILRVYETCYPGGQAENTF